jgi:hypothetical protein
MAETWLQAADVADQRERLPVAGNGQQRRDVADDLCHDDVKVPREAAGGRD